MNSIKERILCFVLAICTLLFGCLFSGDREAYAFGIEDASNPYNMQITLDAEKPANSEICTVELLGIRNSVRFVRSERRTLGQNDVRLLHVLYCPDNLDSRAFVNREIRKNQEHFISFSDVVIVDYIHNQDGQK
ncbi:MAG: hypothetical protein ACI4L2_04810 [Wujia sp.]